MAGNGREHQKRRLDELRPACGNGFLSPSMGNYLAATLDNVAGFVGGLWLLIGTGGGLPFRPATTDDGRALIAHSDRLNSDICILGGVAVGGLDGSAFVLADALDSKQKEYDLRMDRRAVS
ncbi:MAG: hypothetical protein RIC12_00680 [Pirellulales bacterium]